MVKRRGKKSSGDARLIGAGIVLVALAVFFLAGGGDYLAFTGGEGLRVTGITADRTISNDADIANAKFIVNTIFDGSGGAIWGTTVGEQFKDQSGTVIPTQYDIKITADSVNEYAIYHVLNEGLLLRKYYQTGYHWKPETAPPNTILTYESLVRVNYIYYEAEANKGVFNARSERFDVTINAEAGDEVASGTISTFDTSTTLRTGSGKYVGDAAWVGSLVTGTGLDSPSLYAVTSQSGSTRWKVIKASEWRSYENEYDRFFGVLRSWKADVITPSEGDISRELGYMNTQASTTLALPETQIMGIGQTQTKVDYKDAFKVSLHDNNIKWQNPQVVFYIKASWVGAWVPVGMPTIISTDCEDITSGLSSTLHIRVRNDGSVGSTFRGVILSPCKVQQVGQAEVYVPAGQIRTMDMRTSQGALNLKELATCTVKVYDANKAENYDTTTITCQLLKARECVDIGRYSGNTETDCISICNQDGMWEEVYCCGGGEELSFDASKTQYDGWYCEAGNGNGNGDDECYADCVAEEECGLGITIPGMMCRVKCQIMCFLFNKIWYFVAGTVALVLLLVWKIFSKASPHVRAAKVAYGTYKGVKK